MSDQSLDTPTVEGAFRIMPSDIDATRPFLRAFGKTETESAALGIVLYCQEKGSWVPFAVDELTAHFRATRAAGKVYPYTSIWKLASDPYYLFMRHPKEQWSSVPPDTFLLHRLNPSSGRLERLGPDGKYRVTELFVERCHQSSVARASSAP